MGLSLSNFAESIREGQVMGTLEMMLLSPTRLSAILISSSLWAYIQTFFRVIVYLVLGVLVFGANLHNSNYAAALLILVLSILSFSGIGILSAAMVLLVKKGDPVAWLLGSVSSLLAGVYYPISVLPAWLEPISKILPLTYALNSIRLAMLQGTPLADLRNDIFVLLGFVVVLTPLSFIVFRAALRRAKKDGSLIQY
jgi:ABC-2 type transport system permease protein